MAKRRSKKRKSSRRRRVGALAMSVSSPLVKYVPIAAGYFLGDKINPIIDKATGTLDPKIVAAGQVGVGAAYMLMKGKKSVPLMIVTGVIAGAGIKRGMTAFGIAGIGGYGAVPVIGTKRVGGYGQVPVIGTKSVGGYDVPGMVGAYSPNYNKIMGGIGSLDNGSGITNPGGGSCME